MNKAENHFSKLSAKPKPVPTQIAHYSGRTLVGIQRISHVFFNNKNRQ